MITVTVRTAHHGPVELAAEPTTCPGLVITPAVINGPGGDLNRGRLTYNGRWGLTHTASGWAITGHTCGHPAHAHRFAAQLAVLGLDWAHPDPCTWPATDTARVTAVILAHLDEEWTVFDDPDDYLADDLAEPDPDTAAGLTEGEHTNPGRGQRRRP